jgi:hypothetical protein
MGKIRVGNKQNSILNGEWAGHGRKHGKSLAASRRRQQDKEIIKEELSEVKKDEKPRRSSRIRLKKVWVVEYRWISKAAYNACYTFMKGSYSKDWMKDYWKYRFKKAKDARNSIISQSKSSYMKREMEAKEWRIKNKDTGEVIPVEVFQG